MQHSQAARVLAQLSPHTLVFRLQDVREPLGEDGQQGQHVVGLGRHKGPTVHLLEDDA